MQTGRQVCMFVLMAAVGGQAGREGRLAETWTLLRPDPATCLA